MKIGSLFSGVGGLELGLEWAGLGHTVFQVEQDPFCRRVLAKHWPDAVRFENVEDVRGEDLPECELLCGGFPCQDLSVAGKRTGLSGHRSSLWTHFRRIAEEVRPDWIVVENVAHTAGRWHDTVQSELAQLGYETITIPFAARYVGAPHERSRLFIIAHAIGVELRVVEQRQSRGQQDGVRNEGQTLPMDNGQTTGWNTSPSLCRVDDGISRELDKPRLKALGNAVVPQVAMVIGEIIKEWSRTVSTHAPPA